MSGLEILKEEMAKIQLGQVECIGDSGFIKSSHRYRYQLLTEQARDLRKSIKWMEALYK